MFNFLKKLFSKRKKTPQRKLTLGIALGAGGAKGMAHLGALKVFEEEGIEFDVITGASIGSIIGAFYANGMTSVEIIEKMKTVEKKDFVRIFFMRASMVPYQELFERLGGKLYFEELKKPYGCTATNEKTGEKKEFISGRVADAVTASSAIPPYFKPVTIDGETYVDGVFCDAIPAHLCKRLGADIVIGIDLDAYAREDKNSGGLSFIGQLISYDKFKGVDATSIGYEYSDFMLRPNLSEFKATSISQLDNMYQVGYDITKEEMPKIKAMLLQKGYCFDSNRELEKIK